MKKCDKCKSELEPNTNGINHQTIELYDKEYDLCNGCCDAVIKFITGKDREDSEFVDGSEELFN